MFAIVWVALIVGKVINCIRRKKKFFDFRETSDNKMQEALRAWWWSLFAGIPLIIILLLVVNSLQTAENKKNANEAQESKVQVEMQIEELAKDIKEEYGIEMREILEFAEEYHLMQEKVQEYDDIIKKAMQEERSLHRILWPFA